MKFFGFDLRALTLAVLLSVAFNSVAFATAGGIELSVLGTYSANAPIDRGAAEIVAHDPRTQRLFVVNGFTATIDVLDISNPALPTALPPIDVTPYGRQANSVDVYRGLVAVAVEANIKTDPGKVVFFDADGTYIADVLVGSLPDMLTFTPNGRKVLVANEGEPNNDYSIDPAGSVSIISIRRDKDDDDDDDDFGIGELDLSVTTVGFEGFNDETLDSSIRIFGPNASVASDLEPEYIAVSDDSRTAYVTLQENNAIGILNLRTERFTRLVGLGFKDHSLPENKIDASDQPTNTDPRGVVNIANWPVFGMYQPDGIASFKHRGRTYLITANEGDAREYTGVGGLVEEIRVGSGSYVLDPTVFPDFATLKMNSNIGRLTVTKSTGNFQEDTDSEFEKILVFGARSFSIWNADGEQVYDSGDDIEQLTAERYPNHFNASSTNNFRDDRSDNKGPEPESVTTGEVCGRTYAFIGLERIGGILVYDVSRPYSPTFVQYINNRNFMVPFGLPQSGDLAPEGLHFITKRDSPIRKPLLSVANETSGTTTIYEINTTGRCRGRDNDDDD